MKVSASLYSHFASTKSILRAVRCCMLRCEKSIFRRKTLQTCSFLLSRVSLPFCLIRSFLAILSSSVIVYTENIIIQYVAQFISHCRSRSLLASYDKKQKQSSRITVRIKINQNKKKSPCRYDREIFICARFIREVFTLPSLPLRPLLRLQLLSRLHLLQLL